MCGIAGIVDYEVPPAAEVLEAMQIRVRHRGPDEGAIWQEGPCGLAHRRLKIIDLSAAAAQPMANEDGTLRVVFNGEIYNHRSLREELERHGHHFRSRSDTEVLLHGYETWDLGLLKRLRGMFAFALWDRRAELLLLARDCLGKKPLFQARPGRLVFGSELNVLKVASRLPHRLCLPAFREYLEFGYVASPRTLLEGVQRLPAGHYALWSRRGLEIAPHTPLTSQWPEERPALTAAQAGAALEGAFSDAVACRLESDVPLGCFLSGGKDSSLVAAHAQEQLGRRLKTFTVDFVDTPMSEGAQARRVAACLGTDHHEIPVSAADVVGAFEELLGTAAEPLGDDSYVPTCLISRETRRHVTVVLSGDGGDELFAGYQKYRQFIQARPWLPIPLPWHKLARLELAPGLSKRFSAVASRTPQQLARWLSTLWKQQQEIPGLLSQAVREQPSSPDAFADAWRHWSHLPEVERWMLTDMETYLEGDILVKVDRASMAVGLEGRCPFLDTWFVQRALALACRADLRHGGKAILTAMLAHRLPAEIMNPRKRGFGMPIDRWFRLELRDLLLRYTDPARIRRRGLLDPAALAGFVSAHLAGRQNYARRLYAVVAFELWADSFFGPGESCV